MSSGLRGMKPTKLYQRCQKQKSKNSNFLSNLSHFLFIFSFSHTQITPCYPRLLRSGPFLCFLICYLVTSRSFMRSIIVFSNGFVANIPVMTLVCQECQSLKVCKSFFFFIFGCFLLNLCQKKNKNKRVNSKICKNGVFGLHCML